LGVVHRLWRVNLGTAALADRAWCARAIAAHGERIVVGLDVRVVEHSDGSVQHRLAARGLTRDGGICGRPSRGWIGTAAPATSSPM